MILQNNSPLNEKEVFNSSWTMISIMPGLNSIILLLLRLEQEADGW